MKAKYTFIGFVIAVVMLLMTACGTQSGAAPQAPATSGASPASHFNVDILTARNCIPGRDAQKIRCGIFLLVDASKSDTFAFYNKIVANYFPELGFENYVAFVAAVGPTSIVARNLSADICHQASTYFDCASFGIPTISNPADICYPAINAGSLAAPSTSCKAVAMIIPMNDAQGVDGSKINFNYDPAAMFEYSDSGSLSILPEEFSAILARIAQQ